MTAVLLTLVTAFVAAPSDGQPLNVQEPVAGSVIRQVPAEPSGQNTYPQVVSNYGKLPISFEPNVGQVSPDVQYLARAGGFSVGLTEQGALLRLRKSKSHAAPRGRTAAEASAKLGDSEQATLRFSLARSNQNALIHAEQPQKNFSNYLIGDDRSQWHPGVPNYGAVRYSQVYPGIDWVLYGNPKQLEYDLVVAPNANPNQIKLNIDGADRLSLDPNGDLLVKVRNQTLRQLKPVIYQTKANGEKLRIHGRYRLDQKHSQVAFAIGNYDHTQPLVIDPAFFYSTYFGGTEGDYASGIAVDSAGNAYVAGTTASNNFPTTNPLQSSTANVDFFVSKLDAAGTQVIYSTYLGGNNASYANAVAVDASGNAYIAGYTYSTNFPTASPFQGSNAAAANNGPNAVVVKLNAAGSAEVYGTYLGGSTEDSATAIAVDSSGNAYVAGVTISTNFPTTNPLQPASASGSNSVYDAFVVKLNATGSAEVYGTYLGGSGGDEAAGIAVDSSGSAYIAGTTTSTNFPTSSPIQSANAGGEDVFVVKLNPAGSAETYGTYLGGSSFDQAFAIAVDSSGNAYVTGETSSTNFPTSGPIQAANAGGDDAFVVKLNAAGSSEIYGTYLGGTAFDYATGIAVDGSGDIYVAGYTDSSDFPTSNSLQSAYEGAYDGFVVELNPAGSAEVYGTFLGGTGEDQINAIAVDSSGDAYVAGETYSTNFPIANPLQAANASSTNGGGDAIIAKIGNPSTVQFGLSEYTVDETAGTATVTVERSAPFSEPATVQYAATAGTAVANSDFTPVYGSISWAAYDTSEKIFTVPILNSGNTTDRTINLTLNNPGLSAILGSPSTSVLDITADVTPATLQFAQPSYSVNEYGKQIYIAVTRSGSTKSAVTATFSSGNLTAISGTNYTGTSGTLSWAAGDASEKFISLTILDTTVQTSDLSFQVSVYSPTGGAVIGPVYRAIVDIINSQAPMPAPAGSLSFGASAYSVNKPDGAVNITLLRNAGSNGPVSVTFATSNGTAVPGTDYFPTSGTITWANGDVSAKSFSVSINADSSSTGSKTVNLTLGTTAGGASLGTPSAAVLTINESATSMHENEPGTVAFGLPQYSMDRSAGTVTVSVARLGGIKGAASVNYATQDGSALSGTDYVPASGTLTWEQGDADLKTLTIQMLGGETGGGNKTLSMVLSNPQGGISLEAPSTAEVTLLDPQTTATSSGSVGGAAGGATSAGGSLGFETMLPLIGMWRLRRRRITSAGSKKRSRA